MNNTWGGIRGLFVGLTIFSMVCFAADPPPKGFENPELLAKVMKGEIVATQLINTKLEQHVFLRSFFPKASTEAYLKLVTNHAKYPSLFEEILDAKTTKINKELTEFEYKLDVLYQVGPLALHVYPVGLHTATYAKDATAEATLANKILNYEDMLAQATENARLIPYENGILVEDEIHVVLKKANAQSAQIKKMLVEQFTRLTAGFRKELAK